MFNSIEEIQIKYPHAKITGGDSDRYYVHNIKFEYVYELADVYKGNQLERHITITPKLSKNSNFYGSNWLGVTDKNVNIIDQYFVQYENLFDNVADKPCEDKPLLWIFEAHEFEDYKRMKIVLDANPFFEKIN